MLALIAGEGDLPLALLSRLDEAPLICALAGNKPSVDAEITFHVGQLGSLLNVLKTRGVTSVCMAGAIDRPQIDPTQVDAATAPFVLRLADAIAQGDDGALREIIAIFEETGFAVKAAHDIAPDLLPRSGVLTTAQPADWHQTDALIGQDTIAAMGAKDIGQACIVRMGQVVACEYASGTDAMLAGLRDAPIEPGNAILFKAPKPTQDRRVDLPVIGPQTAPNAADAGLAGIIIEAGGVMVLNQRAVIDTLNAHGMFLWVRMS